MLHPLSKWPTYPHALLMMMVTAASHTLATGDQLLFTFSYYQIFYIPSDIFTSHHHIFLHKTKPISNYIKRAAAVALFLIPA